MTFTPVTDLVNRMRWDVVDHNTELSPHDLAIVNEFVEDLQGMSDDQVKEQWGYNNPADIADLRDLFNTPWDAQEVAR
jgi:hypothetical protein